MVNRWTDERADPTGGDPGQPRPGQRETRTWREEDFIHRDEEGLHDSLHGRPAQFTSQEFRGESAPRRGPRDAPGYDYERYGPRHRADVEGRRPLDKAGDFLHRAGERVAAWFGETDETPGPLGNRGKGPRGYVRSDERISDDVHERLTDDFWLDASDTTVAVASGELTLAGTVADRRSKHRAERLVEDILGVKHVQNNLRVRAPEPEAEADTPAATI